MDRIDDDTLEYVGILAKLELDVDEKEAARSDMEKMLGFVEKMNELDTSGIVPMTHVFDVKNVLRDDVVTNGDGSADALKNAPAQKEGQYMVPITI